MLTMLYQESSGTEGKDNKRHSSDPGTYLFDCR